MIIDLKYYQHLVEEENRIGDGKNRIYFSEYLDHYSDSVFRNFSIKFLLEGKINFKTEGREFDLCQGSYLLSHKQTGVAYHESNTPVRCICIDIQEETIVEAFQQLSASNAYELFNLRPSHFFSSNFFDHVYPLGATDLGITLARLGRSFSHNNGNDLQINSDFFTRVAKMVIVEELANYNALRNLHSIRNTTKRETLRRLLQGRSFIDENYLENPSITEIAGHCNLSTYHFLRSFKQAFGCTPYQYMLQKRMDYAGSLVNTGMPITQVANRCNFADLFAFSKAFKKIYHLSPSQYKKLELKTA